MASPNLGAPDIPDGAIQPNTTANTQVQILDNATQRSITHTVTGDFTLTDDEFRQNHMHILAGTPGSAFVVRHGAYNRNFAVRNISGQTATLRVTGDIGSTAIVNNAYTQELYCDATDTFGIGAASRQPFVFTIPVGSILLTGLNPFTGPLMPAPGVGSLSLTGFAPTVTVS